LALQHSQFLKSLFELLLITSKLKLRFYLFVISLSKITTDDILDIGRFKKHDIRDLRTILGDQGQNCWFRKKMFESGGERWGSKTTKDILDPKLKKNVFS
jgi:hypothetical protein